MERRGWYSRGYLPHLDIERSTQFVTWRLADALPATIVEELRSDFNSEELAKQEREFLSRVEAYCDAGHGTCVLRDPGAAQIVQDAIVGNHGELYDIHHWVVMPNHVHVLFSPNERAPLAEIMKRLKGGSSRAINAVLGSSGRVWQPDYFDRLIRDRGHFERVAHYIEWNPVKAGLCSEPKLWPWGSAHMRA